MTITTVTRTIHITEIQCDNCENVTHTDELTGWKQATKFNGLEHITRHLCPDCYENCEAQGFNQTWTISEVNQ